MGLFGAFIPVVIKSSAPHVTPFLFFSPDGDISSYAHRGFLITDWTSSILQSHCIHQKIKTNVKPGAPVWKVEWVYGENLNRRLICLFQKLSPALLEELPHVMTSSTNVWIVFVVFFAVIKDQVNIDDEGLKVLIPEIKKRVLSWDQMLWCNPKLHAAGTYWLLTSFSRMVVKSIGFLMTFL